MQHCEKNLGNLPRTTRGTGLVLCAQRKQKTGVAACRPPTLSVFFLSLCASFHSLNGVTKHWRERWEQIARRGRILGIMCNTPTAITQNRRRGKRLLKFTRRDCDFLGDFPYRLSGKLPANHRRFPDARSGRASSLHKKHLTKKLCVRLLAPALLLVPACRPVPLLPRTVPLTKKHGCAPSRAGPAPRACLPPGCWRALWRKWRRLLQMRE